MTTPTTSAFFVTGGTLRHDAPSYVERQADHELFAGLLRGEFCYVLTARQMGKSSLMVRTAKRLRERGVHVILLDLTAVGQNLSAEQWYDGLLRLMGMQLGIEEELERFWVAHERLGPLQRWMAALTEAVMPALEIRATDKAQRAGTQPIGVTPAADATPLRASGLAGAARLVIFVDEIDVVRSLPFPTDEFFAAIRACYNRRTEEPVFNQLGFCLLGVATPSDLIRDTRLTPFNIGRRIELHDFTSVEAAPLARGLDMPKGKVRDPESLLARILHWTSGHPYLTQRLCQALAEESRISRPTRVDRLCEELFFRNRAAERDDNLIFVRERMLRSEVDLPGLLDLYFQVRRGRCVPDDKSDPLVGVLRLSGVVKAEDGWLRERNRIYHRVFDREWVRANMPQAELRRQVAAFWRGVLRTSGIAAVVILLMAWMVAIAVNKSRAARRALARAYVSQADAIRVSGLEGQRFRSLAAIQQAVPDIEQKEELRDLAIAALALVDLKPNPSWVAYADDTTDATLSGDFTLWARGDRRGAISVNRVQKPTELVPLPSSGLPVAGLWFSPNNEYLTAHYQLGTTNRLVVWDWQGRRAVLSLARAVNARALDFSADSQRVGFGCTSGALVVHALPSGALQKEVLLRLPTHGPRLANCVRFAPAGDVLALSSDDSQHVLLLEATTGRTNALLYHPAPVLDLAWHPSGDLLATACADRSIYLWRTSRPERHCKVLRGHDGAVQGVAFSHHGDLLASTGADRTLRLWVPATDRQMVAALDSAAVYALFFSADDRQLGFGRRNAEMQTWTVHPPREYRVLRDPWSPPEELLSLDFSADGRILAAASEEGLTFWDTACARKLAILPVPTTRGAFFQPTAGRLLASSSLGLHQWTLRASQSATAADLQLKAARNLDSVGNFGSLAFAGDGRTVVVIRGAKLHVLRFAPAEESFDLDTDTFYHTLAVSRDGRFIAARPRTTDTIDLWDLRTRAQVPNLSIRGGPHFAFSPDGESLAMNGGGGCRFLQVGTWQVSAAVLPVRLQGQPSPLAFSHDGKLLALAESPSVLALYRLPEREVVARLRAPDRTTLLALAFSPGGRRLAAAGMEQAILVWDLALLTEGLAKLGLPREFCSAEQVVEASQPIQLKVESGEAGAP
ncbi:MAG: AAA-like domain-containing protein [Verrucomicrobia bacterium]|nr:AAA-like domain-containing protein [Verrucomicrobiota bacterium]